MQSKKRFTEINIWEASFFMELTPKQKLFWYYLNDRCDNIGVWEPNFKLVAFNLELEGNPHEFGDSFLQALNDRVIVLESGHWFLPDFVKFQYCKSNNLNSKSPAHKSYIELMKGRNLWEWFCENQMDVMPPDDINEYLKLHPKTPFSENSKRGLKEVLESHKDKDTDKEKAQEEEKATDTDKDTPLVDGKRKVTKETGLEFEMRSKGMLNETPF
jgi:hypothetical protein